MSFSIRNFVILSTCFLNKYFSSEADNYENCCHQCCDCLKKCFKKKIDENSFSSKSSEPDNNNNNDIISNNNNDYNNNKNININFENNNKINNNVNLFNQNNNNIFNNNNNNNQINNNFNNINNDFLNNINQNQKEPEPISFYKKPTLIGLNNIGSTCYKNAVLQCLSQTEGLTNYFLKEKNYNKIMNTNIAKQNPNLIQLCPIYYDLIQNLWKKDATFKSFSPNEFMNSIAEMTQNDQVQFSLYEAGDAKDFIIYLLERMHNELKQPLKNKFGKIEPKDQQLNQYDKHNSFLHFLDEFQNDTSIISDLFYGFNETTNVCQFCKKDFNSKGQNEPICYNYGIFNILIFPLEEVRKYREQFMAFNNVNFNMGNMSNMVTMFECFLFNQKSDFFTGDDKNYCNICKQLYESVYTSKIFSSPNVLIIILNRGKGNMYNIKLDFGLQMDISNFVLNKGNEFYNLYGVITHIGESGPNAHFIASCKSPVDHKWYRYNDAFVEPIQDFKKDIYDFGTPYILFYEKQK